MKSTTRAILRACERLDDMGCTDTHGLRYTAAPLHLRKHSERGIVIVDWQGSYITPEANTVRLSPGAYACLMLRATKQALAY